MSLVLDQIKKLDDRRKKLLDEAKEEALKVVNEAINDLNALGFHYRLVDKPSLRRAADGRKEPDDPCPICKFKTNPPHDGRRHRAQGNEKKPLNAQELSQFGFIKV
jgi:hypothetical protein